MQSLCIWPQIGGEPGHVYEPHQMGGHPPLHSSGWIWDRASDRWLSTAAVVDRRGVRFVVPVPPGAVGAVTRFRHIDHSAVVGIDEVAPFDCDPLTVEVRLTGGEVLYLQLPRHVIGSWCGLLSSIGTAEPRVVGAASRGAHVSTRWRIAAMSLVASLAALVWFSTSEIPESVASDPTTTTVRSGPWPSVPVPATTPRESVPNAPANSGPGSSDDSEVGADVAVGGATMDPENEPSPFDDVAVAPLTGLPARLGDLLRPALVSKIDASRPAMPQVGMELADVVYEVKVEGMSRYLAVWHSKQPVVVGPHRSARTTDPDLLSMFGHPLFAFSGANPGVVQTLAATDWKTGVGPGEVGHAYFRDERRPWPNNLFAVTDHLRSRPSPPLFPSPIVEFHRPDQAPTGLPVDSFSVSAGTEARFGWDPVLGGWRRWIWGTEHLHATGDPVAPTNVVVLRTDYVVSHADANSPEAVSVGSGAAWVFTRGEVRVGRWDRAHRFEPWNLRSDDGSALTLEPGTSWVVLADRDPVLNR